ncbi:hypothetical protein [Microscilla marina]|uniref:Uncharacterized protein n=1 Tax=Microscilla marina ATCC 23134 TaxID=313606 RepID=A1ZJJ4_MICM2|nr:hypothetical protein [Microscilla marina]EAY29297.1 hypothetical protein M23134_01351 [Microscilla marina ATCC 23134]
MKCPKCEHEQKYKEGMTCLSCKYKFIIDPKEKGHLNDYKMKLRIEQVSQSGQVYFTPRQLYALYRGKFKKSYALTMLVFGAIVISLFLAGGSPEGAVVVGVGFTIAILYEVFKKSWLSEQNFLATFNHWYTRSELVKEVKHLVLQPELKLPKNVREKDIYNYGVEAVIVTDQDVYVDLFVKNNYHTQYKALIISKHLYPTYLTPRLKQLLQEKPDLPLFFIHDATLEGLQTMTQFRNRAELATEGHPCIDLGLTPAHFNQLKPLKRLLQGIDDTHAPLDYLQHQHFTSIFNKYIVERAEQQALLSEEELSVIEADELSDRILMIDLIADDFG